MQYVVIGRDGTDAEAPAQRQAVRPNHLEGIAPLVGAGNILVGGAILDDDTMRGSMMLVDFLSDEALHEWLDHDRT
jgi:uncharacterized protein YciI